MLQIYMTRFYVHPYVVQPFVYRLKFAINCSNNANNYNEQREQIRRNSTIKA